MARIAVYHATEDLLPAATALARELNLPLHDASASYDALLHIGEQGLSLVTQGPGAPGPLSVDFADPALLHRRRSGHNEPLGRALGVHKWPGMSVVDATAGLGRESFVIADLGARVTMLEKHPAVFALLRDGLRRGQASGTGKVSTICNSLVLYRADSGNWLLQNTADAVYLDPMFPARQKSARVKKGMWVFQQLLEQPISKDAEQALLEAALGAARRRVVVKRPVKAPPLAALAPGFSVPGKTVRFDVYDP